MHSFEYDEFTVHHNGDFSGDVKIYSNDPETYGKWHVELPFDLLARIVAEKIRRDKISALENMEAGEVLGLDS